MMKLIFIWLCLFLSMIMPACKKTMTPQPAASLNVINAAINAGAIKVNTFEGAIVYASLPTINYGSNAVYTVGAGNPFITVVRSADTLHPVYSKAIFTESSGIYSLYLAGQSPTYDTLLLRDDIPFHNDSTTGIRFINLSPNSGAININLTSTSSNKEFSNLTYKQVTEFKTYPALSSNATYSFQIRDAVSNNILSTYVLTTARFFNTTLVLKGLTGTTGTNAFGVQRVNNY